MEAEEKERKEPRHIKLLKMNFTPAKCSLRIKQTGAERSINRRESEK